ncbi:MAG: M24 family metallopeptidase [SAR324 cluster bacterium]|uniref:Xaa-Pro aminopeptidase n=1 Tax=SAR324 cluster bacterium TaxID=2024889 RepID=A0A7X9FPN2_9DELT|nr:M24 family metallopeptidase [SAR324 cluster bacterium]
MNHIYRKRIAKLEKKLKESNGALILSSAPLPLRNRDSIYPYRQNSDFYYLCGSSERDLSLLVSSKEKAPLLFAPKTDPKRIVWEGETEDIKKIAKNIGANLLVTDDPREEITTRLRGVDKLYFQNLKGSLSFRIAKDLMKIPVFQKGALPSCFENIENLMLPLRIYKDKDEINLIKKASSITSAALDEALPYIAPDVPERFIQATIDYWFRVFGGENAFPTIVGSGPNAAFLHYDKCNRTAKKGELMLIDCGAEYQCYASDLTRVFPVSGYFEGIQADVYGIVLEAQKEAIKRVKHGVKVQAIYDAAAKVLCDGLLSIGILKGKASKCFQDKAFLEYFPHSISHTLGLDVHDVGNLRGNNEAVLEEGMVISVEPGLYFRKRTGKVPPCGVRIEDIVHVTKKGCEVLSSYPKEFDQVMETMSLSQENFDAVP